MIALLGYFAIGLLVGGLWAAFLFLMLAPLLFDRWRLHR